MSRVTGSRRTIALALTAVAVVLVAASALGQAPSSGDRSFGSGHVLLTDFTFSSSAGPNGEDLTGVLTTSGFLDFTASMTCGSSSGNQAVGGYRIQTGDMAGRGFISAGIDNGPPRGGRPVDVIVYSGFLHRPPRNCPSPGEPPPEGFRPTGGGPFTSGDFTLVNTTERLAPGTPRARLAGLRLRLSPRRRLGLELGTLKLQARVCGLAGMALLRAVERSSPTGRARRVDVLTRWHDELPHEGGCVTHRTTRLVSGFPSGRRYTISLRARTTGRRWSRPLVRYVDGS